MLVFNIDFNVSDLPKKELVRFGETQAITEKITKEYVITALIEDNNTLSYICETEDIIGNSLKSAALEDIKELWPQIESNILEGYKPTVKRKLPFSEYGASLESLVSAPNAEELLKGLVSHYKAFGAGKNAKYIAFRWDERLIGIENPDSITLGQLYCLDSQKKVLEDNTAMFMRGAAADNALLYGSKGSGKSSMIKAILNKYYKDGLRMAEISKEQLAQLPRLIDAIKGKSFKYIIFMDDLSFENNELGYKYLKVVLEGQIEKIPQNILFYVTSNRRHMVNEIWEDRQGSDVHINDTMNEKLSLTERFGIKLFFPTINQMDYLKILESILAEHNIQITDIIKTEAIRWELSNSGKSGRAAAQFAKMVVNSKNYQVF